MPEEPNFKRYFDSHYKYGVPKSVWGLCMPVCPSAVFSQILMEEEKSWSVDYVEGLSESKWPREVLQNKIEKKWGGGFFYLHPEKCHLSTTAGTKREG